jgi:hypothetical protein
MAVSVQLLISDYRKAVALGETSKAGALLLEIRKTSPTFGTVTVNRQRVIADNYSAQREINPLPKIFYPVDSGTFDARL